MRILNAIYSEILTMIKYMILSLPGRFGSIMRRKYWQKLNIKKNYSIGRNADILFESLFIIGENFILGDAAILDAGESKGVYIGDNVGFARNCFLRAANHKFDDVDISWMKQGHECASINYLDKVYSIVIEDDVWIGANVVILTGTHLSKGVIVAAGSVVSGFVKPYSVIIGNPARTIKNRLKVN